MITTVIKSEANKTLVYNLIKQMPLDGSFEVITKKKDKSSTAKQRGLQWRWYTDVATSGLGQYDDKQEVHTRAKWLYARPIFLRDDPFFGMIYEAFMKAVEYDPEYSEKCKKFSEQYISTERMSRAQRAEYLTNFQRFWLSQGVELADPDSYGLNSRLGYTKKELSNV